MSGLKNFIDGVQDGGIGGNRFVVLMVLGALVLSLPLIIAALWWFDTLSFETAVVILLVFAVYSGAS